MQVFHYFMTLTILSSGILVGIETQVDIPTSKQPNTTINVANNIILAIFTIEVGVKMGALGTHMLEYFDDNWNRFDFVVVLACFIFLAPPLQTLRSVVQMLRLLRLLRVIKLMKSFPKLQVLVTIFTDCFQSVAFVLILLFGFIYVFAIVGMMLLSKNDPTHFADLYLTSISLYRTLTFDGWSDLL